MNPAQLKLELLYHGINAGEGLPDRLANPFGLVHLVLPRQVAVSIHLNDPQHPSPYTLSRKGDQFLISYEGEVLSVGWTPPLECYQKRISSGIEVADILTVHGGYVAIHPRGPCRFGASGLSCRYCGSSRVLTPPPQRPSGPGSYLGSSSHPPFSKRDLVEALQAVLREERREVVNLSSGRVDSEDGGVEWLAPWVEEIRKHVNILISLDLAPPKTNRWIDEAYAIGVDALYYDLEVFNPQEISSSEFETRRQRHLEVLEYAAEIFPAGAVLSHLVLGLEPLEKTRRDIDLLIDRGVVPLLVYFPPHPGTELARRWGVSPEQAAPCYAYLFEKMVKSKIPAHWVQQQDVVLTPLEGRFFSPLSAPIPLVVERALQTEMGRRIRRGLIALRRRLRVLHLTEGDHVD